MAKLVSEGVCRGAEGVMFLGKIAEGDYKKGSQDFRRGRVPAPMIHKKFQEDIVKEDTDKNHGEIAPQLDGLGHFCLLKYYISA